MPGAMDRARRLNDGPRQTYALIKQGLERALTLDLEQAMELESQLQSLAADTPDAKEAIQAFLKKRKPQFGRGSEGYPLKRKSGGVPRRSHLNQLMPWAPP